MAKIDRDNPLAPIYDKVARIRDRLEFLIAFGFNAQKAVFEGLKVFIKNLKNHLSLGIQVVGKSVVNGLIKQADKLMSYSSSARKIADDALKIAVKILGMIEKAAKEPQKAFKAVKAMVARLAKAFRQVVTYVKTIVSYIDPIAALLKVIDTFKMALRVVASWITQVSPLLIGVKRLSSAMKKVAKTLQAELKQVTQLVKDVNTMKIAT